MTSLDARPRTSRSSAARAAAPAATRSPGARRTAQEAWDIAATTAIWISSLVVIAIWVAGGGIEAVLGFNAETLNTLGRISGLVSANLLLYQVLLMARVPLFERGFGRDGITRMHRLVGFWSFWLLIVHIALLVAGYAAQAGINPLVQLWEFVWDYPGMLLATVATLLLTMVVVTSIRRARRAVRYESWHLLHLYGYLGVGLAIPHMLWTGADFASSPLATAYWWAMWAVTAGAVLIWRIGLPLWRSARHDIRVSRVAPDGTHGVAVYLRGRNLSRMGTEAGQFFIWRFLDGAGWSRGHPLSLAAAPTDSELVIAARIVGDGTHRLTTLRPGTKVLIEGPYGHLTGAVRHGRKLLMIGAGAGVTPLVSLLESESFAPGEATLLTRDHSDAQALRQPAIGRLVSEKGLVHVAMNGPRARQGSSWIAQTHSAWRGPDLIRYLAPDAHLYDVFICGPKPWMTEVKADLRAAGIPLTHIHSETFAI